MLLPVETCDKEKHDKHDPKGWKCSINWKLSKRVDNEDLSPRIVKRRQSFFVNHEDLYFEFIQLVNKHRYEPESNHKTKHYVKSNIQWRLVWDEGIYVGGSFCENEPIPGDNK